MQEISPKISKNTKIYAINKYLFIIIISKKKRIKLKDNGDKKECIYVAKEYPYYLYPYYYFSRGRKHQFARQDV
jgi:hypothetical protein